MLKAISIIFTIVYLVTLANSQGTLLEMSQQLWSKLLTGGFSKAGKLDPLRVPVIKVDQSEGNTSYRIILKNVEITGLNESTLDSIHIARGRLKSNLSELEAGYVSYSDLRDLDSIRYRFHTLIKEPKAQNESFEAIVSSTNQNSKFKSSFSEEESGFERFRQYDPFLMKIQAEKMKEDLVDQRQSEKSTQSSNFGTFSMEGARVVSKPEEGRITMNTRYPSNVEFSYAMNSKNSGSNSRNNDRKDSYDSSRSPYFRGQSRGQDAERRESFSGGVEDRYEGQGRRDSFSDRRSEERYVDFQSQRRENYGSRRAEERAEDVQTSASENVERFRDQDPRIFQGSPYRRPVYQHERRVEKEPGYIDIVYADGYNGSMRRFGNGRIESKENAQVYGVKDYEKVLCRGLQLHI